MAAQMVSQSGSSNSLFCNSSNFVIGDMYSLHDLSKAEITAPRLIMLANVALTGDVNNGCCDYTLDEDKQMAELTTVYDNSFSDSEGERMETEESLMESDAEIFDLMELEPPQVQEEKPCQNKTPSTDNSVVTEPEKDMETHPMAEDKNKSTKSKPFQCRPCQYKAESEEDFVHHIKDHSAKRFIDHDQEKHTKETGSCSSEEVNTSKGPIRCDRCGYNTNRIDHYLAHLKHHNKAAEIERVYKCTICTYTTVSEYHWKKHLRNHFPRIVYTCSQCSYFSDRKNNYIQHIRTHTGERPYQCIMCTYSSSQKTHLTRHMRTHSGEKPFKCEQCNYVASNQHEVTRHARQLHNGPKPLTCPHCNYKTADRSNFKKHVELHVNPRQFLCPVCDYAASKKCNLQYHIKSRHSGCTDITMDVSKVKLRTKKDLLVSELGVNKQETENSDVRSKSIEKTHRKHNKEKCETPKSSKRKTVAGSDKNVLKMRPTKRKCSFLPEKPLKTKDAQNTITKKRKLSYSNKPIRELSKKGAQTKKPQKHKSLKTIFKGTNLSKNKSRRPPLKADITKNKSTKTPLNAKMIILQDQDSAKIVGGQSGIEDLVETSQHDADNCIKDKEQTIVSCMISADNLNLTETEHSSKLSEKNNLNEEEIANLSKTPVYSAEKKDEEIEPLAEAQTLNHPSQADEFTLVDKECQCNPLIENALQCRSEDLILIQPPSSTTAVQDQKCGEPSPSDPIVSASFDVEEDEGIHSHEGSDISDNISERSDDSGLNGLQYAQEALVAKTSHELPPVEKTLSETFICIFCDRTFKKAEEYTKHLKRHLVNVYYLEKAAQDQI